VPVEHHRGRVAVRTVLTVLGFVGLAVVVLMNRQDLRRFWALLGSLRWYVVAAVVVVQLASYWVNGLYYQSILRVYGHDLGTRRLFEGALATNFVNYVLPSVGIAGAAYLSQVLSPEVPRGEGVLTQLMRYALSALAVLLFLPIGFALIVAEGLADRTVVKVTLASCALITVVGIAIIVLVSRERWLRAAVTHLVSALHRVRPSFSGGEAVWGFVDSFYEGFHAMGRHRTALLTPFGWSLVYIVIELATFYLAFLAFGRTAALGAVILAYLFANIASTFGGVFFSTGTFELGMAATLVALGTPVALAAAVTIVYRMLNLLIGLPPGYVYYRKYLPAASPRDRADATA
jgi:putative heme transporter